MRLAKLIATVLVAISVLVLFSYQKGLAYTLEESFQRTLLQEGATKLSVSNRNGNIEVNPWQEDSIRIEATKKIKAANKKKAREYAEELKIEISREGNEIIIRTIRPELEERRGFGAIFGISKREIQAKVDYNIRIPEKLDLDIRSRNGSIKTGGIKGDVTGETRNGGIQIDDVKGEISARSRNGSISLAEISGPVDVETRNGKISLSEITGSVKTVTRNGNIRVNQADEDVSAHSRNGSISLLKIGGSVNASTRNGKIWTEITGKSFQGCDLSTRNANITLIVPESLSADLDVYSRNGKVKRELPVAVSGSFSRGELKGKINQGGPLLRVRTTNGNITVEKGTGREGKVEAPSIPEEKRESARHQERWDWELPLSEEFDIWPLEKEGWEWDAVGRFNRVEGSVLGLKVTACPTPRGQDKVYVQGDYGFARKKWTYRLGVEKSLWKKLSLGADLHDIVATQDGWIVSDQEATLLMLLAGTAARDYFRQQGYEVYLGQRLGKAGDLRIGYCSDKYESLPKRTDWSLVNWRGEKRSNPPINGGWIKSIKISYRKELPTDQHIEFEGELADKELGGDFQFRRCQVELVGHRKLAWKQFLDTRVTLGFADRELPRQRKFQLGGIGTLRCYDYKEFQGDGMLLVQVEYRFKRGDKALVPFVDAGCTWPHNRSIEPEDLRFDGGIGLVWEDLRLNLAVAPPRKPHWLLRFHKNL